jgi:tagatose-1,6-bisphosphate aldolase
MNQRSLGKIRALQRCSNSRGAFSVLALDHRNNLRNALNPQDPNAVTTLEMSAFKTEVVRILAPHASSVLLDPEFGAAQCIAAGSLPGQTGLIVSIEATGYTGDPSARQSRLLPGWCAAKTRSIGADAVKLLVYYHPDAPNAPETEELVIQVAEDCQKEDLAFFLEPLSYSLNPAEKKLSPAQRRRVVLETARRLVSPDVDVLKAEFPLDIQAEPNESNWIEACTQLSQASLAPWILLSASVGFETYLRQVTIACQAGASGVAVGRAVWQEAPILRNQDRTSFLETIARERMSRISSLVDALALPWHALFQPTRPETISPDWYLEYGR